MMKHRVDAGFTVVEVVVTLVIISLFLTLFFQLFLVSQSQRVAVIQRAAANDIAQSNLRKITAKTQVVDASPSAACDGTTSGGGNPNNLIFSLSLNVNSGSIIATDDSTNFPGAPAWGVDASTPTKPAKEPITGTGLPTATTKQTLRVSYPRGCTTLMPAKIISIVTYGSGESVVHAGYVN